MREPDKGSEEGKGGQGSKGPRGTGEPWRIKEDGGAALFPHQIVDFTLAPAHPVLSRTFPHLPTPFHSRMR